jgi:outer membrane autotransporter protein
VSVVAAPGNYARSTTYTILNAAGGAAGTYSGVNSNLAFLTPTVGYDANNVFLTLAMGQSAFASGARTANQFAVGPRPGRYRRHRGLQHGAGRVGGAQHSAGAHALYQISGQPYADFGSFNVADNALFMNALGQQMALARGSRGSGPRLALAEACDVAACDGTSPFSVWAGALGGVGSVQGDGNSQTFTYNVGGTAAGIDYRLCPRFLVGIGAGYTSGAQLVDSFMGKGWLSSVSVAACGSFAQGAFYIDALAGYVYSNNQMQRQLSIPGLQQRTANGSTGANQFLGQVEAGYKVGIFAPPAATLTPFGRLQASTIDQAAFSEWGANSLTWSWPIRRRRRCARPWAPILRAPSGWATAARLAWRCGSAGCTSMPARRGR